MNIKGQLFVRKPVGINNPNVYIVCGLIKTDKLIDDETIHTMSIDATIHDSRNVEEYSRGSGFDGIMTTELWNLNLMED